MPDIVVFLWTLRLGVCDIDDYAEMFAPSQLVRRMK
jgi:hypothetical protein